MHFHYTGIQHFGRGAIRGVITAKKWWCQSASYDIQPEADKKLSTRGPITLFGFRLPVVSCTVVINARFPLGVHRIQNPAGFGRIIRHILKSGRMPDLSVNPAGFAGFQF